MAEPINLSLTQRTALVKTKINDLRKTHPSYTERQIRIEAIKQLIDAKTINF